MIMIPEIVRTIKSIIDQAKEDGIVGSPISTVPIENLVGEKITLEVLESMLNYLYDDINVKVIKQDGPILSPVVMVEIIE